MLLADIEHRAHFLHLLLRAEWPQPLELRIVERQTDGEDLREQIDRCERTVVVINVVDINLRVAPNGCCDSLVPCRVEDS